VIDHYSQPGRSFTITADLDAAVKREIQHLPEAAWQPYRTAEGMAADRVDPGSRELTSPPRQEGATPLNRDSWVRAHFLTPLKRACYIFWSLRVAGIALCEGAL
jgi:hypothetical protein